MIITWVYWCTLSPCCHLLELKPLVRGLLMTHKWFQPPLQRAQQGNKMSLNTFIRDSPGFAVRFLGGKICCRKDIQYVQELCSIPFSPPSNLQSLQKMGLCGGWLDFVCCFCVCMMMIFVLWSIVQIKTYLSWFCLGIPEHVNHWRFQVLVIIPRVWFGACWCYPLGSFAERCFLKKSNRILLAVLCYNAVPGH